MNKSITQDMTYRQSLFEKVKLTNGGCSCYNNINAGVAELADAPDLGSGISDVQVQVLSPVPKRNDNFRPEIVVSFWYFSLFSFLSHCRFQWKEKSEKIREAVALLRKALIIKVIYCISGLSSHRQKRKFIFFVPRTKILWNSLFQRIFHIIQSFFFASGDANFDNIFTNMNISNSSAFDCLIQASYSM